MKFKVFFGKPKLPPHRWLRPRAHYPILKKNGEVSTLEVNFIGSKKALVECSSKHFSQYAVVYAAHYEIKEIL